MSKYNIAYYANSLSRTSQSSPLLLQRQRGVNAARLKVTAARGGRQGREGRAQDLLSPALLPEMLVVLRLLLRRLVVVVAEGGVEEPLVPGRTLAAVELRCGEARR